MSDDRDSYWERRMWIDHGAGNERVRPVRGTSPIWGWLRRALHWLGFRSA